MDEHKEQDGYLAAAEKWIEDEMWNQRERRPPDLHDVSAFCRGYREGVRDGIEQATSHELNEILT
jgi:hypothetical protein